MWVQSVGSCTPAGKGRVFPGERRPSVLLTQSRTRDCRARVSCASQPPHPTNTIVKTAFGSRGKLCYHKHLSKPSLDLAALSSAVEGGQLLPGSVIRHYRRGHLVLPGVLPGVTWSVTWCYLECYLECYLGVIMLPCVTWGFYFGVS